MKLKGGFRYNALVQNKNWKIMEGTKCFFWGSRKGCYSQGNIGRQRECTNFEDVESSRVYRGSLLHLGTTLSWNKRFGK